MVVNLTSSTCLGSPPATFDCPGSQYFASPLIETLLRPRNASAPPSALTASLTRLFTGCAAAGCNWLNASSKAAQIVTVRRMRLLPLVLQLSERLRHKIACSTGGTRAGPPYDTIIKIGYVQRPW